MLKRLRKEEGISLVILIIMVVFVGITVVGIHAFLAENIRLSDLEKQRARALYLAEMGISDSFWELKYSEKLYGPPTQPYGQIDQKTVNFYDGSSGTYEVPEPTDSIVSTGIYREITRKVKVGIETMAGGLEFSFFCGENTSEYQRFSSDVSITGNAFANSDVRVYLPTLIDTNTMTLYLSQGHSAIYDGGDPFPYTTLDPPPAYPSLDVSWYQELINRAGSGSTCDSGCGDGWKGCDVWDTRSVGDTVFVDRCLIIAKNAVITSTGTHSVIVSCCAVKINSSAEIADNIKIITKYEVLINDNVSFGTTTGRSGNLLFSLYGDAIIKTRATINGAILSNENISVDGRAVVNGLTYARDCIEFSDDVTINGAVWADRYLSSNTYHRLPPSTAIYWNGDYLPSPMPIGLTPPSTPGGEGIQYIANSWREL